MTNNELYEVLNDLSIGARAISRGIENGEYSLSDLVAVTSALEEVAASLKLKIIDELARKAHDVTIKTGRRSVWSRDR